MNDLWAGILLGIVIALVCVAVYHIGDDLDE